VSGHHAVAGHDLIGHAEIEAPVGDQLVQLLEGARVEQQVDPFVGGQLAGRVLALSALLAASQLRAPLEVGEKILWFHASGYTLVAACTFSQSLRNFSRPMFVSGWLNMASMTAGGQVQTSAPIRPASTTWIGCRTLATSTSVVNS
jgi:hypothetical protein